MPMWSPHRRGEQTVMQSLHRRALRQMPSVGMADEDARRRTPTGRGRTNQSEALVDIEAVTQRLGVQVRHVRRLVIERRIPFLKWGHLLRFDPADIEAWLDE